MPSIGSQLLDSNSLVLVGNGCGPEMITVIIVCYRQSSIMQKNAYKGNSNSCTEMTTPENTVIFIISS